MIKNWILISLAGIIIFLFTTTYVVQQTQKAIILRLGNILVTKNNKSIIIEPGLHFKIPIIDNIKIFDTRLQTLEIDSSRIMTKEQKDVLVDAYIKYRIYDLSKYFKSTGGNLNRMQILLKQKVNDGMREIFGKNTISELLSSKRNFAMQQILKDIKNAVNSLGIKIIDVRIKRIDLPTEVTEKIYERMRSAREKMASLIRANGEKEAELKRAKADSEIIITLAKAKSIASKIRALGEERSAEIYANAYASHHKFYEFYKSLEAYKIAFKNQGNFILNFNNLFLKYFKTLNQN